MSADLPEVKYTDRARPINPPSYEFTPEQNEILAGLAYKMQGVGFVIALIGILNAVFAAIILYGRYTHPNLVVLPTPTFMSVVLIYVVSAVVYGLIGSWTRGAGFEFQKVADTQGKDIAHLMNGLTELHKMYSLLYTLILFAIVLFLVALMLGIAGSL